MAHNPETLIRIDEVVDLVPFSRNHIYRMVRAGEFPPPLHIGPGRIAWRERDVLAWRAKRDTYLKAQAEARSARARAVVAKRNLAAAEV